MWQHSQDVFYVELMQSSWLSGYLAQQIYTWFAVRLTSIFMGALLALVISPFFTYMTFPVICSALLLGGWLGWLLGRGYETQRVAGKAEKNRG
jgi:hypothetical protein